MTKVLKNFDIDKSFLMSTNVFFKWQAWGGKDPDRGGDSGALPEAAVLGMRTCLVFLWNTPLLTFLGICRRIGHRY
jgi:hypothetical protein